MSENEPAQPAVGELTQALATQAADAQVATTQTIAPTQTIATAGTAGTATATRPDTGAAEAIAATEAIAADFAPPKPKRPFPWRWAGACIVVLAVGSAGAYGVLEQKRTDLPGLKTPADGRYGFAPLTMPTLAPGQADPTASANMGSQHLSDIRKLLLPAPVGASTDHSLPGATGWVSESASLALLHSDAATEDFATDGWRHTAGTAWKTPDGAETKIYLMQFIDDSAAGDANDAFTEFDSGSSSSAKTLTAPGNTAVQYSTVRQGSTNTWYGEAAIGDTEFLIEYTAPVTVGLAPFEQEVDLQAELLQ